VAQIRVRRGTTAEWGDANPVLAAGEPGFDVTTETFKVGNGVDQWTSLDEIKGAVVSVNGATGVVVLDAAAVGALADDYAPEWDDVTDKPSTFPPSAHTHDDRYYTEGETDDLLNAKAADSAVVKLSGNQTVAGTKTFSTIPVLPNSSPSTDNQAARKKYVDDGLAGKAASSHTHAIADVTGLQGALDDKVEVDGLISEDPDNTAGLGSDGGVWVSPAQPPGDYVETSDLAEQFKYAAAVWVLEANEDETDLPGDFPDAPFFTGGPPPIVLRKKDE